MEPMYLQSSARVQPRPEMYYGGLIAAELLAVDERSVTGRIHIEMVTTMPPTSQHRARIIRRIAHPTVEARIRY